MTAVRNPTADEATTADGPSPVPPTTGVRS